MPIEGEEQVNDHTGETAVFKGGQWVITPPSWGDTLTKDLPRATNTGLINQAVPGVLGMAGDAENVGQWLGEKIMSGIFGYPPKTEEEKARLRKPLFGSEERQNPTADDLKQIVDTVHPPHIAATETGRMGQNVAAFSPAMLFGGGLRNMLKSTVVPGVASQGASDAMKWLGGNELGQNIAYLGGAVANPTAAIRGQVARKFVDPKNIDKAKEYIGNTSTGGALAYLAHQLGAPGAEMPFLTVFGHHVVPETIKKIPGNMVFGSSSQTTSGDVAAFIRALQETGTKGGPTPAQ